MILSPYLISKYFSLGLAVINFSTPCLETLMAFVTPKEREMLQLMPVLRQHSKGGVIDVSLGHAVMSFWMSWLLKP